MDHETPEPSNRDEQQNEEARYAPDLDSDPVGQEEFSSEIADVANNEIEQTENSTFGNDADTGDQTTGWIALALAFLSLFVWPAILGPIAVVAGIVAWMRGSRALGIGSIVLGLISFLVSLFLLPLYA